MTWIGPRADDLGTPIAWLMTTLFVLAAIQVAEDRPGEVITDPTGTTTTTSTTAAAGAPTLLSVSPASGSMDGGTEVRIVGRHIDEEATVRFGATAASVESFFETEDDEGPIQELIVTAPAHVADTVTVTVENPDGQTGSRQRAYVFVDYDATTTTSTTTTSTSATSTTSTSSTTTSTSATTTSSTTTSSGAVVEDHSDVVWAFEDVDADQGVTYSFLGIWPHDQQNNPAGPVDWYTHRLGRWDYTGSGSTETLGDLTVEPDTDTVSVDANHECVQLRLFAFDEDAFFVGGMVDSTDYQRFPWSSGSRLEFAVDYYYLGDGATPSNCNRDWPGTLEAFRDDMLEVLTGRSIGEAAMIFVPQENYTDFFGWGDLSIAGQIEGIRAT